MGSSARVVDGPLFAAWVRAGVRAMEQNRAAIDALNVFPVPDGDTGTNMWLTLSACQRELDAARSTDLADLAAAAARGALLGARGNSGVILSQFFRGFSRYVGSLKRPGELDGRGLARAMEMAARVAYEAVIRPVEGTMLTVGREAARWAARAAREPSASVESVLAAALEGARHALAQTPRLLPVLAQAGVVDAGGQGLVVLLEAARALLAGEGVQEPSADSRPSAPAALRGMEIPLPGHGKGGIEATDLTFRYCTEFLVRGRNLPSQRLRRELGELGDSLLVVGDEQMLKCHVHTNHPGRALEAALKWGELLAISISNMQEQNREAAARRAEAAGISSRAVPAGGSGAVPAKAPAQGEDRSPGASGDTVARPVATAPAPEEAAPAYCSVVAVASGSGLADIFRSLGVEEVVDGGKTMNPSTQDLAAAADRCRADSVIILPNHANVILTARQAAELTRKRIHVVPSRSVPQGLAAALAFRPDRSLQENAAEMEKASERVTSGEVTYAVRDSQVGAHLVKSGDVVGMTDGELVSSGPDLLDVTRQVARRLLSDGRSLLTLYYGQEVSRSQAEELARALRRELNGVEVELYYGGQPIYYFILSAE